MLLLKEWDSPAKRIGMISGASGVEEIRALVRDAFAAKPFAEWERFLTSEPEIIWERVRGYDDVLTDPQNLANGYIADIDLPVTGKTQTVGTLMDFSATPTALPAPPPALGGHTAEVMAELGFGAEDIRAVQTHGDAVREEMYSAYMGDD